MKKTAFVLALLLCLSQFVACDDKDDSTDRNSKDTEASAIIGYQSVESDDKDNADESSNDTVNLSSQVDEFIDLVKKGEYLKAVEYYEKELYGNYQYETEASDGIVALLKNLNKEILNGQKSESDSKIITGAVDNVLSETNMQHLRRIT